MFNSNNNNKSYNLLLIVVLVIVVCIVWNFFSKEKFARATDRDRDIFFYNGDRRGYKMCVKNGGRATVAKDGEKYCILG